MHSFALGMIETRGLVASIEAADVMLKTAHVTLLGKEVVEEGLVTIQVAGDVASVVAAVDAARSAVPLVGELIGAHVIPKPARDIEPLLRRGESDPAPQPPQRPPKRRPAPERPTPRRTPDRQVPSPEADTDLESMTVHELRALARQMPGLSIAGREISRANKTELLLQLRRVRQSP